ncbi:MBL fold metallo-hydrolase [Motiliproteus sp.]|uniref:MBL fold metallo-hydrolase n=1 Tax=Motiliproteus sp. TaxID=1898955 RepID=UPI003BABCF77
MSKQQNPIKTIPSRFKLDRLSRLIGAVALTTASFGVAAETEPSQHQCPDQGHYLQVLGSGGPEINDGRSSTSYLLWVDGKARVLIDAGSGSAWRFEQSGARMEDLTAMLFTHLHVDHSADLPIYVKSAFFTDLDHDIDLYGPAGGERLADFVEFIDSLFGAEKGAYRYLNAPFNPESHSPYHFIPHRVPLTFGKVIPVKDYGDIRISAAAVAHGFLPALAWRIDVGDKSVTISGDMNGQTEQLIQLGQGTDLLIAHTAINEQTRGAGQFLHMKPSRIGEIADQTETGQLVLSHFMNRSLNREDEIEAQISSSYGGKIGFAQDLSCWALD